MREILFNYPVQNKVVFATIHQNDGLGIFNTVTKEFDLASLITIRDSTLDLTDYKIELSDFQDTGIYAGNFPTEITQEAIYLLLGWIQPDGNFGYIANEMGNLDMQQLPWSGQGFAATPTVPITSLSTTSAADIYMNTKLHSQAWFALTNDQRQLALNEATAIINRFNYLGYKSVLDQPHEWPRSGIYVKSTTSVPVLLSASAIPNDILYAQFEIALALASGVDPEKEMRSLFVTSRGFSSVRTTYDPKLVPPHLQFGVPSAAGWAYLYPYLSKGSSGTITLRRVS